LQNTRIALVQMTAIEGDKKRNLKKTEDFVKRAAAAGVDIVCFPEMNLCGYGKDIYLLQPEPIPGDSSLQISRMSLEYRIIILAGIAEKCNEQIYITHLAAFPNGDIKKYRKTHLGRRERDIFSAGDELPVFKTNSVCFGIGICYDMHFPELATAMANCGAEIIFAPFASPLIAAKRIELWKKFMAARAYDNGVYIATCNQVGFNRQLDFGGGMVVWDPVGTIVQEYSNKDESMMLIDLNQSAVNQIRENDKQMNKRFFLADRRKDLYRKYL